MHYALIGMSGLWTLKAHGATRRLMLMPVEAGDPIGTFPECDAVHRSWGRMLAIKHGI